MPRKGPKLSFIVEINMRFLRSLFLFLYGLAMDYLASLGFWGFDVLARVAFIGAGLYVIGTLYKIFKFWQSDGEIAAYEEQGQKPKADRPTDESILDDAGMIE